MMRFAPLLALILISCGDDPVPPPLPDFGMDMTSPDMQPDTTTEPDLPPDDGCSDVRDLGVVTNNQVIEQAFAAPSRGHETTCQTEEVSTGSALLMFEVEERARLTLIVDPRPTLVGEIVIPPQPIVELRQGQCVSENNLLGCEQERNTTFEVEPGVPYFLALNGDLNSEGARVQFRLVDVVCDETDNRCVGDKKNVCVSGLRLDELPCAAPCVSDSECGGDTCGSAIELQPTGMYRVTGTRAAYEDTWTAEISDTCSIDGPEEPAIDTPYADLVLHFPNVPANTQITASAENEDSSGSYAFFFSSQCEAQVCLSAGGFDAFGFNEYTYETESSGDVYLRIESLGAGDRTFAVDVSFE